MKVRAIVLAAGASAIAAPRAARTPARPDKPIASARNSIETGGNSLLGSAAMTGSIRLKAHTPVAAVTLDAPGKLNAVRVAMCKELRRGFASFVEDASIRGIAVRGIVCTPYERDDRAAVHGSNDHRERVAAFLARRPPRCIGT